ncbi:MAG: B12-binding domain-containing radical SAM protein [Candidatus Anammoxibacter sp.]
MKVALINPDWGGYVSKKGSRYNRCWPPLSLLNCAALLEGEGIDVTLIDLRAGGSGKCGLQIPDHGMNPNANVRDHQSKDLSMDSISELFDKIFVTSSPMDRWQCPNLEFDAFLEFLSQIDKTKLFIMGVHGTILPEKILELTQARAVIRGEPEYTVLELCKVESMDGVEGVTFFEQNGSLASNNERPLIDLNDLPIPAFHLLDFNKYYYEILGDRLALFEGSRGCPSACIYCLKAMYGKGYRKKKSARLIDEVDHAIRQFKVKSGYFIDLEFTINRELVEDLCEHLIKHDYDFRWCCQTRADTVDTKLLVKMKKAGCRLIHYGVETGSDRVMKIIKKKINHSQIKEGIVETKKAGIEQACFFLFGFPSETEEDMIQTIEFAKRLNPTYASFHIVSPYPGTDLYNKTNELAELGEGAGSCNCHGNMTTDYSSGSLFPEYYANDHSMAELKKMVKRAYREFYFRPGYVASRILNASPQSWLRQYRLFKNMSV